MCRALGTTIIPMHGYLFVRSQAWRTQRVALHEALFESMKCLDSDQIPHTTAQVIQEITVQAVDCHCFVPEYCP